MNLFLRRDAERTLADCNRRIADGATLQDCIALYPRFAAQIQAHFELAQTLSQVDVLGPPARVSQDGRRALLTALPVAPTQTGRAVLSPGRSVAAVLGIGVLVLATAGTGASAAGIVDPPRPFSQVLNTLGVESNQRGKDVSDGVHDAIDSTDPGPGRGKAVSEAACESHDRGNLPDGAQQAPGQVDKEAKDCEHPNSDGTPGNSPNAAPQGEDEDAQNPGRGNSPDRTPKANPGQGQGGGNPNNDDESLEDDEDEPGPARTPPPNPGQGPPQTPPGRQ